MLRKIKNTRVLEERAIIALTKFETMVFKEQLMSQIRCMNLPKEPAQASIVLFLRDLIGFCESSDCIGDFLKILKASRIKDQTSDMSDDTIYQLPTSIIGKLVLLTLDSAMNIFTDLLEKSFQVINLFRFKSVQ